MNVDPVTGEVLDDDGVDVEVALPVRRYATVEAASRKASLVGPDKVRTLRSPRRWCAWRRPPSTAAR